MTFLNKFNLSASAVLAVVGLMLSGCSSSSDSGSEGSRQAWLAQILSNIDDPVPSAEQCVAEKFVQFTDAEIADHVANNSHDDIRNAAGSAYEVCSLSGQPNSEGTVAAVQTGDPDLDALAADPSGWLQAKYDIINEALCGNKPELLDEVYTSDSSGLPILKDMAGTYCSHLVVVSLDPITGWSDVVNSSSPTFIVVDNGGWKGDGHSYSCTLVKENGVWKLTIISAS